MWSPSTIPMEKAVVTAVMQKLQSGIADLNTLLAADNDTKALLDPTRFSGNVLTSHVKRGQFYGPWLPTLDASVPNSGGSIRIHVSIGDFPAGVNQETRRVYIPDSTNRGLAVTLTTTVCLYVHSYWRRFEDFAEQERVEEITVEVLSSWMRGGALNKYSFGHSSDLPLTSSEYNTAQLIYPEVGGLVTDAAGLPCYDLLADAYSRRGSLGVFRKGYGQQEEILGLHYTFTGTVGR